MKSGTWLSPAKTSQAARTEWGGKLNLLAPIALAVCSVPVWIRTSGAQQRQLLQKKSRNEKHTVILLSNVSCANDHYSKTTGGIREREPGQLHHRAMKARSVKRLSLCRHPRKMPRKQKCFWLITELNIKDGAEGVDVFIISCPAAERKQLPHSADLQTGFPRTFCN